MSNTENVVPLFANMPPIDPLRSLHGEQTRERWLERATFHLRADFLNASHPIPERVRVSVGFPGGRHSAKKAIGQHWHPSASSDGISQIFISPVLGESYQAIDTLVHELIHSVYPSDGHRKGFQKACKALGLSKPWKSASVPIDSAFGARLNSIIEMIGPYPHAALNLSIRKKQGTRMLKCECLECGYVARVSSKWLDDKGAPICPWDQISMEYEVKE